MSEAIDPSNNALINSFQEMRVFNSKYDIMIDNQVGRCLVAKEELKQGEVIIKELPIVSGPSRDSNLVCFNCYNEFNDKSIQCRECHLPLCGSVNCNVSNRHFVECQVLKTRKIENKQLLDDPPFLHELILVLRCFYLKEFNPIQWNVLMNLQSHSDKREATEFGERAVKISDYIILKLGINSFDRSDILNMCGILDTNSFEIPLPGCPGTIQALYGTICLAEHNCIPSCHRIFGSDLSLSLLSSTNIQVGKHLSITYTDSLWSTIDRRTHLFYSKHFHCTCLRCSDPTENDSFLSALKCNKCADGIVLATNPLEVNDDEIEWKCRNCSVITPAPFVGLLNTQVSRTIQQMEEEDEENNDEIDNCKKFISCYSLVLHPQHAHMIDVKHSLLHLLGHSEGYLLSELSDENLDLKQNLANLILSIAFKILPGISRLAGTTLYELFLTIRQKGVNLHNKNNPQLRNDVITILSNAADILRQSLDYLKYEPDYQPEGILAKRAQEDLLQITDFINELSNKAESIEEN